MHARRQHAPRRIGAEASAHTPKKRARAKATGNDSRRSRLLTLGGDGVAQALGAALDFFDTHIQVGDGPDRSGRDGSHEQLAFFGELDDAIGDSRRDPNIDDVGFDRGEIHLRSPSVSDDLREPARFFVIEAELRQVVLEGVERCGGEDAGLAHGAAEHAPMPKRSRQELLATAQRGADRCPEALGEAHAHGVGDRSEIGEGRAARYRSVPQARAIEVYAEPVLVGHAADGPELFQGKHSSSGTIVCVLHDDEGGMGQVVRGSFDGLGEVWSVEQPALARDAEADPG